MDNYFSNISLPLLLPAYSGEERISWEQHVSQLPGLICIFRAGISPRTKTTPHRKELPWDPTSAPSAPPQPWSLPGPGSAAPTGMAALLSPVRVLARSLGIPVVMSDSHFISFLRVDLSAPNQMSLSNLVGFKVPSLPPSSSPPPQLGAVLHDLSKFPLSNTTIKWIKLQRSHV